MSWLPIETYDRRACPVVALLCWHSYRHDPHNELYPVRYVGSWDSEYGEWCADEFGDTLDLEPTHWVAIPEPIYPSTQTEAAQPPTVPSPFPDITETET